jgi:protein-disulfide isomerase
MDYIKNHFGKLLVIALAILLGFIAFYGYKITKTALSELKTSHVVSTSSTIKDPFQKEEPKLTKNDVEEILKNYIVSHPEIIVQSLEDLQQSKLREQNEKIALRLKEKKAELENSATAPFVGNAQGDVTVVAFIDYNCGYCKKANNAINALLSSDVGVKVVYHLHPILGEGSEYIAKIALAVNHLAPSKFQAVHNKLMEHQINSKDDIVKILEANELSFENIQNIMESLEVKNAMEKSSLLASYIGATGVPTIVIADQFYPGFLELDRMKQIIDEIRTSKLNNNTAKAKLKN